MALPVDGKSYYPGQGIAAGPCHDGVAITPSDSTDLATPVRALYCTVAGSLKIKTLAGNDLVFGAVAVGPVPFGANRVYATGTSATVVGGY